MKSSTKCDFGKLIILFYKIFLNNKPIDNEQYKFQTIKLSLITTHQNTQLLYRKQNGTTCNYNLSKPLLRETIRELIK